MGLRGKGAVSLAKRAAAAEERASAGPHPWDAPGLSRYQRVLRFCESLPVTSGALSGTQWRARPFQKRWLRKVYRTDKRGKRLVRTAILSMGRKGGKTDLAARLCLCHFVGPEAVDRGECYSAANDRFQASRIFAEMASIVERTPWMANRINVVRFSKQMEDLTEAGGTGSVYVALSADVATKHGLSPTFWVYDELGQAPNRELYDVLDTAMGAHAEPLGLVISTQAATDGAPLSVLIDYGLRVQAGEIDDPAFLLEFYTSPADADPWIEATWRLANPALGDFRSIEDVRRLASQAQRMPSREASFRNLILNQRVDTTAQFITTAAWNACGGAVDLDAMVGRRCTAALDLGASRDLTALVLTFDDGDGGADVLPFFWLAGDLREREDEDKAPYPMWAKQGHLMHGGEKTLDPAIVARKIAELHGRYHIEALAFDRWRMKDLERELSEIGVATWIRETGKRQPGGDNTLVLVPFGQGFKDMSPAVDEMERLVLAGKMRHGRHPVLTMCVANTKTESDAAGNRKPSKNRSTGRIDGLVSLCMAVAAAMSNQSIPVDVNAMVA